VDGVQAKSPVTLERVPGEVLVVKVEDPRFASGGQECEIAERENLECVVVLHGASRPVSKKPSPTDEEQPKRRRLIKRVGDDVGND
jgi:hypothetical protein